MNKISVISAFVAFASLVSGDAVIEFTDANFKTEIDKYDFVLVEFFAPWCGHCKKLAPEYEKAAARLKTEDPPIALAKVDCIANPDTCSQHGVSGYPTLKIFRNGASSDYSGPRQEDGIVSYVLKQAAPAYKQIDSVSDWEKFTSNKDAVVVGYFDHADTVKLFKAAAEALREDYKFGVTSDVDVLAKVEQTNKVVLHRPKRLASKFEDQQVIFEGKPNKANLEKFLKENVFGLCGHATPDNFAKLKRPVAIAFDANLDYVKNAKGSNYWRNRVMKFGKPFADRVTFAVGNLEKFQGMLPADLPQNDGADKNPKPVVVLFDANERKYVMSELFSKAALETFLQDYLDGKVAPFIKSEAVPEPNDGPVTVVVGKNFDEVVMDENKDVLVEFYAPWCGHCKSLAPKWDELGEKLKDEKDVVIAKIDATANDSPSQFAVSGFPTIYWAPKNNKANPKKYQGAREVKDFMKFIKDNASAKLKTEL